MDEVQQGTLQEAQGGPNGGVQERGAPADAQAEATEQALDIAAEAQVRAGGKPEEAEMWGGVSTDEAAIEEILTRAVVDVIVRDELRDKLRSGRKLRIKLGIDPTGPRLHIGRAVQLLKLRQFQNLGHQIVLIIGDFTALVGDASDKDTARPMLTREEIEANMQTYKEQVGRILDLLKVEFRYNSEWLRPLNFNDVIRLASRFTVAQMIQRENFSDRWDQGKPIGLHEILYPLMQGFDSVAIEADMELGGTDQLFNLMAGRELQADFDQPPQSVMVTNMIPGTDGRKMSTTWGNAVYLLDDPRDQFGKIMSMGDDVIPVYLESCTLLPVSEVEAVGKGLEDFSVHPMDAKKRLAWEIVRMYHGEEAANRAREDFERQFQQRGMPSEVPTVSGDVAFKGATPRYVDLGPAEVKGISDATAKLTVETGILDLLVNTGLAPSKKQAQRLVEQGAVSVNGEVITDREQRIERADKLIIKVGRRYLVVEG